MDSIRRWTRTVIPGSVSLLLLLVGLLILVPEWRQPLFKMIESDQGTLGWAGIGLVAATLMGYVQSHIYFAFGWEWMTIPYERFPGVEKLGLDRSRSRSWALLSHRWQKHALCIGGFDSINERLEGLGDALHALGGVLAGTVMAAIGMAWVALVRDPRPTTSALYLAALIWLIWLLVFICAYVMLHRRFKAYVLDNIRFIGDHEGPDGTKCPGVTKDGSSGKDKDGKPGSA